MRQSASFLKVELRNELDLINVLLSNSREIHTNTTVKKNVTITYNSAAS